LGAAATSPSLNGIFVAVQALRGHGNGSLAAVLGNTGYGIWSFCHTVR